MFKKKLQVKEEVETLEKVDDEATAVRKTPSQKEKLLNLYQKLKDLGVRSISDLENLIARAE